LFVGNPTQASLALVTTKLHAVFSALLALAKVNVGVVLSYVYVLVDDVPNPHNKSFTLNFILIFAVGPIDVFLQYHHA
jgi:hypothetical protein